MVASSIRELLFRLASLAEEMEKLYAKAAKNQNDKSISNCIKMT